MFYSVIMIITSFTSSVTGVCCRSCVDRWRTHKVYLFVHCSTVAEITAFHPHLHSSYFHAPIGLELLERKGDGVTTGSVGGRSRWNAEGTDPEPPRVGVASEQKGCGTAAGFKQDGPEGTG